MIYRWKHPSTKTHLWGILQGFAELLDGCVTICSLGFFASRFEITIASKRVNSHLKELKNTH